MAAAMTVLGLGLGLGTLATVSEAALVPAVTSQQQQELFLAIEQMLTAAHAARQDMPKKLLSAEEIGPNRYRVHCQMVQGDGWFEVTRVGDRWQVTGINPPGQ